MYDTIIIGAGPAGMSAAVYATRKGMKTLLVTKQVGGQIMQTLEVDNYLGFKMIKSTDLVKKFEEHVRSFDVDFKTEEVVNKIEKKDNTFTVKTEKAEYQGKTVIVAAGKRSRELGIPGEKEFKKKGVSYCATCDGPFFQDQEIAIVGGGNSGCEAALQMISIAKKIYLIHIGDTLSGDPPYVKKLEAADNVEILLSTKSKEIYGENFVKGITVETDDKERNIDVQGIFVEIGYVTDIDFVDVDKNRCKEIKVKSGESVDTENMTDVPGIFAAGDVTDVINKQIIVAAGEGAKAALAAFYWLTRQ